MEEHEPNDFYKPYNFLFDVDSHDPTVVIFVNDKNMLTGTLREGTLEHPNRYTITYPGSGYPYDEEHMVKLMQGDFIILNEQPSLQNATLLFESGETITLETVPIQIIKGVRIIDLTNGEKQICK